MGKRAMGFLFAFVMLVPLPVAQSAGAATPARASGIAGTYTVNIKWKGWKRASFVLTLRHDHTGIDSEKNPVTWSLTGKKLTFVIDGGEVSATYVGIKNAAGFCASDVPCRMTNTEGNSGHWYAVTGV